MLNMSPQKIPELSMQRELCGAVSNKITSTHDAQIFLNSAPSMDGVKNASSPTLYP